jgi:hypothetical protein
VLRITDHGPGIPAHEQARVFEPFHGSGTGLGLAIARGFVELNGGRDLGRVAAGHGTTFALAFPAVRARSGSARERAARARRRRRAADPARAADEAARRRLLGRDGGDREEALMKAACVRPRRSSSTCCFPDGSGTDVCRELRRWNTAPILVLSAVGEEKEKIEALDAGADDYVTKPFSGDELLARLRAALRRAAPSPEPSSTSATCASTSRSAP